MSNHSDTMGPSSAPALMQCARFESGGNDEFEEYAITGTLMHKYCENRINQESTDEVEEEIEIEQIEACDNMLQKIKNFVTTKIGNDFKILTERRIEIKDSSGKVLTFGTSDLTILYEGGVIGGDFKSDLGFNSGKVDYRPQMHIYALGLMQEFNVNEILWFEAHIMSGKLIIYNITYEQAQATFYCAWKRKYSKLPPQACYYCRMCKKITHCSAVNTSLDMIGTLYKDIENEEDLYNPWTVNDPDKMANLLSISELLSKYDERIKKVRANIVNAAKEFSKTKVIPFYEVKETSKRKIKKIFETKKLLGLSEDEIEPALNLAIGKIEKEYHKKSGCKTLKKSQEQLSEVLFEQIEFDEPTVKIQRKKDR